MIDERDLVALTHDVSEYRLVRGDVGTVVHRYRGGDAFEVEFVTAEGTTVVVVTLDASAIRPVGGREILHVRDLASASA